MSYIQARVQELLGGGGAKYFNHKWTLPVWSWGGVRGHASPGKLRTEWFSCTLVNFKGAISY